MKQVKFAMLLVLSLAVLSFSTVRDSAPINTSKMQKVMNNFDPSLVFSNIEILSYGPPEVDDFYVMYSGSWGASEPDLDVTFNIYYNRGFRGTTNFNLTITMHSLGSAYGNPEVEYFVELSDQIAARYPGQYGHIQSYSVVSSVIH